MGKAPFSYSYLPKVVYENQIFPVTIVIRDYNPKDPYRFEYDTMSLMQPLFEEPHLTFNKGETFATFYFKVTKDSQKNGYIEIPDLSIWNLNSSFTLYGKKIKVKKLEGDEDFSHVIASSFRILSTRITSYDTKTNLIYLKIKATEANLEDMHLSYAIDDGIENLERNNQYVTAEYYFILPKDLKEITFNYYNPIKNSFVDVKVNIDYSSMPVVENSELSPKKDKIEKIKRDILVGLLLFFILMLIFTRDKLYLLIVFLILLALYYIYKPYSKICVEEGAPLYILPIQNSTIEAHIDKKINTNAYYKYKNFYKIEYKPGVMGWIKDEDLCKD